MALQRAARPVAVARRSAGRTCGVIAGRCGAGAARNAGAAGRAMAGGAAGRAIAAGGAAGRAMAGGAAGAARPLGAPRSWAKEPVFTAIADTPEKTRQREQGTEA